MDYFLIFCFSFALCFILTRFAVRVFPIWGVVDRPDGRKSHKKPTPHAGGVAVFIVFIISFSLLEYFSGGDAPPKLLPLYALISAVSFWDDLKNMKVLPRLAVHLFCCSAAIFFFLYPRTLFHGEFGIFTDFVVSSICFAAFVNLYNFLDGIDGLTCLESAHLSVILLLLCYLRGEFIEAKEFIISVSVITLACSVAFAIFNFHPAKIFLGDTGSVGLGFLLGLCLALCASSGVKLFAACCVASLYYLADGGITILVRLASGEKIWEPHLKHFFQKASARGLKTPAVISRIAFCNFLLAICSVSTLYYPIPSILSSIVIVGATLTSLSYK